MVDPELLAFLAQALLGGAGNSVEVDLVAGVQAGDHQAADVVQQRCDRELVAFHPADDSADAIGGTLSREGVDAEALGLQLPAAVGLEEVEAGGGPRDREHPGRLQRLDGGRDAGDAPRMHVAAIGVAQNRDRKRDIALDGFDDLAAASGLRRSGGDHSVARLRQDGVALDGLESLRQTTARRRCATTGFGAFVQGNFAVALGSGDAHWPTHRQQWRLGLAQTPFPIHKSRCLQTCQAVANRWAAARMRSSERSRPSTASDSKIPGETEVPVIATRIGW
jgi:hypothetical protein